MSGKPFWDGFRIIAVSDMVCRAVFRPDSARFGQHHASVGKYMFSDRSVMLASASAPPRAASKNGNPPDFLAAA
jgi:hypothetical protein